MSLTRFIIRFGATGSTARWVGKNYLNLQDRNLYLKEILTEITNIRYSVVNLNEAKDKLLDRLDYINNLTDFTFSILQLEGAIKTKEMTMHMQMEITTVIMEELQKLKIPEKLIIGSNGL